MPRNPKKACSVCRRADCNDPSHKRTRWEGRERGTRSTPRPITYRERKRRKEAVERHRAQYGDWCPVCGGYGVKLTAEHVVPVALGGSENQPLTVACEQCQHRQGAAVANKVRARRRAISPA